MLDKGKDIQVVSKTALVGSPTFSAAPFGKSLAEIVAGRLAGAKVGARLVEIDGEPLPRERWETTFPQPGAHVLIYTSVHGDDKNPLATILSIVVIAAASYVAGPGAASLGLTAGQASFAGMLISSAGLFLVNQAFPPRKPPNYTYNDSQTYSLSAARNVTNPWGPVPLNLGENVAFPPLAAKTYTELVGQNEYIRMLLLWGYGPVEISDIKIGDTPIESFNNVQIQNLNGSTGQSNDLSLFPSQVHQEAVGSELTYSGGAVTRTAQAGADELSVEILFPRGLTHIDSATGRRAAVSVGIDIRYREVGGTWIDLAGSVNYSAQTVNWIDIGWYKYTKVSLYARPDGTIHSYSGVFEHDTDIRFAEFEVVEAYDSYGGSTIVGITGLTNLSDSRVTGMACTVNADGWRVDVASGSVEFDSISVSGNSAEALRYGKRWEVDRSAQYEVEVTRTTTDSTSDYVLSECQWSYLRSIINDPPTDFSFPVAMTALRIRATGQLSGIVDNVSAKLKTIAPTWDGADWDTWAVTKNPAALYHWALMCPANPRPVDSAGINDDDLAEWYEECAEKGYEFNMYRDYRSSMWDLLADIAAAGMASPDIVDGKWTVIVDTFGKPISQHFTPRNSWGFSAEKKMIDHPHAVRVRFKNEDQNYEWDEIVVYADGYDAGSATLFEQWEFAGVTNAELNWKHARRRMAQAKLRPEFYSFYVDFERLATSRGKLVRMAHDVPLWGSGWGRVKSLVAGESPYEDRTVGVVLDEKVVMEAGYSYSCRFRLADADDTSLVMAVSTVEGETNELSFTLDPPIAATLGPQVGDLAMFGVENLETQELIVHSIESIDDMAAKLTCVDYAPGIDSADTGEIPPFETGITGPTDITRLKPAAPSITDIESGKRALDISGTVVRARMIVTIAYTINSTLRLKGARLRYKATDDQIWRYADMAENETSKTISDVEEGRTYTVQAQAISQWGVPGDWGEAVSEYVTGQDEVPPDVENFSVNIVGTQAQLTWDAVSDPTLSYYRIRWSPETSGASWAAAVDIVSRVPKPGTSANTHAMVGTYLIKAVDLPGNESDSAAAAITTIARIEGLNVVETFSQSDPSWSGTGTDADEDAVLGGIVLDDPDAAPVGYYEFDSYVDLAGVFTSRLSVSMEISGQDLGANLYDIANLYTVANLYGSAEGLYSVEMQLAGTDDDPAGTPTWSAWRPFIVGDYTYRAYKFRAKLTSLASGVTPILEGFTVTVDMPDRVIGFTSAVGTGGASITFSPAFFDTPEIGISVSDGAEGDGYTITGLDESGFSIAFTNGGSPVARNIKGVAKGYGSMET